MTVTQAQAGRENSNASFTLVSETPQLHRAILTGGSCGNINKVLDAHNAQRHKWRASPLKWSASLAQRAQRAVDTCKFQHTGAGENLYLNSVATTSCEAAVPAWNDEQRFWYLPGNPDFSLCTGHWTQVVWKGTREVGCARKYCPGLKGTFIACEYNPPGNFLGEFAKNVDKAGGPHCSHTSGALLTDA